MKVTGAFSVNFGNRVVALEGPVDASQFTLTGSGAVTQTSAGNLNVGTLIFNVAGQSVELPNAGNEIGTVRGAIGNLKLGYSRSLTLGALTAAGDIALVGTGGGTVSQSGALSAGRLGLNAEHQTVVLNNSGNKIGIVGADVHALVLANAQALTIGSVAGTTGVTAVDSMTLAISGGAATQDVGANIDTPSLRLEGSGAFTLPNRGNQVGSLSLDGVGGVTFATLTSLQLTGMTGAAGDVEIVSGEDIIVSGNNVFGPSGTKSLVLRADRSIIVGDNARITSDSAPLHVIFNARADGAGSGRIAVGSQALIETKGGDIVLGGGGQDPDGRPDGFAIGMGGSGGYGILIGSQAVLDAGAGNVAIRGQGSAESHVVPGIHGQSGNPGQRIHIRGQNITLEGRASEGDLLSGNTGVHLVNATITSPGGNIRFTGTGYDATGAASYTSGLNFANVRMETRGNGAIELTGTTNGAGNSGSEPGANAGIRAQSLSLTTVDGDIVLAGQGRYGVFSAIGGDGGEWKTGSGHIVVAGEALGGDFGLNLAIPLTTVAGDVTLTAHSASGSDSIRIGHTIAAGGTLYLQPRDADTAIGLWEGTGRLNLSATDLSNVASSANVVVGSDTSTGKIIVGSGLSGTFGTDLELRNRGAGSAGIEIHGLIQLSADKMLTLSSDGEITQGIVSAIVADKLFIRGPGSVNNKRFFLYSQNNEVGQLFLNTMNGGNFRNGQGPLHVQFGYGPGVTEMALHGFLNIDTAGAMSINGNLSMYEDTSEPWVLLGSGGRLTHQTGSRLHAVDAVDLVMEAPEISLAGSISGASVVTLNAENNAVQEASSSLDVPALLLFSENGGHFQLTSSDNVVGSLGVKTSGEVSLVTGGDLILGWTRTDRWGESHFGIRAGQLGLSSDGVLSQLHAIDVDELVLRNWGTVQLNGGTTPGSENNVIGVVAADLGDTGMLMLQAEGNVTIGSVDDVVGIRTQMFGIDLKPTVAGGAASLSQGKLATIVVSALLLRGEGTFALDSPSNAIGILAADVDGPMALTNQGEITIGLVTGPGGVAVEGVSVTDRVSIVATGNIRVSKPITAGGAGDAIVLSTDANFHVGADAGETPLDVGSNARFLVYSTAPDKNSFEQFASPGNLFGRTFEEHGPETIDAQFGSRLIYSHVPTLHVTADDIRRMYGSANGLLTWTLSGLIAGDTETTALSGALTTATTERSNAGTHGGAIALGTLMSPLGYQISFTPGDVTIDRAQLTITGDQLSKIYGDDNPELTWTHAGLMSWDDIADVLAVSATTVADKQSGVDDYVVTITGPGTVTNYDVTYNDGSLKINKAKLTITGDQLSKIYGDDNPELTWAHAGLMSWDDIADVLTVSATTAVDKQSGVGEYTLSITGPNSVANYDVSYVNGSLKINKAQLTITGDQLSKTYGDDNPDLTWVHAGLMSWDDIADVLVVSATTVADEQSGVGDYVVTISGPDTVTNYDVSYVNGSLKINKAQLTITGDQLSKIYGDDNPELTWTHAGLMSWDDIARVVNVTSSTAAGRRAGVGDYVVTITGPNSVANYDVTYVDGKVFISPASIIVRTDDANRPYGTPNPNFTVSYDGFKLDHDDSILQGILDFETLATLTSEPGSYIVTPDGLVVRADLAGNYNLTFAPGTLTVYAAGEPQVPGVPKSAYGATVNEIYRWLHWRHADDVTQSEMNDDHDEAEGTGEQLSV